MSNEEFLWCEKYRPKTIDDCILPQSIKNTFSKLLEKGELPNMLFSGTAGVGKTTVARALCEQLGLDYIVINGSMDANMEALRGKIRQFASTVSLAGGYKVIILDEADYLNNSVQASLRGFIEEFSNNCRFILTCNFKNKIIEPLHSRCSVYDFTIQGSQKAQLAAQFFKRLGGILKQEGVQYEPQALASLVERYFPDWRRVINECQRHSASGSIDAGSLVDQQETSIDLLFDSLKEKDFKKMRKWVAENIDVEPSAIMRSIYDRMYDRIQPNYIPQVVLTLADYQYKDAFVADHEINMVACLTEIMANVEFN